MPLTVTVLTHQGMEPTVLVAGNAACSSGDTSELRGRSQWAVSCVAVTGESSDARRPALVRSPVQDFRQRSVDVRPAPRKGARCLLPIGEVQRDQGVQVFDPPLAGLQPWKILAP